MVVYTKCGVSVFRVHWWWCISGQSMLVVWCIFIQSTHVVVYQGTEYIGSGVSVY